jgi:CPA2 family monovalent cation:H+ antiporter-2
MIAASLAQIGEFSFILAGLGLSLGLIPQLAFSLVIAGAFISIALNPFVFRLVEPLRRWLLHNSLRARAMDQPRDPMAELPMSTERRLLEGQVVIVGYGVIGQALADALSIRRIPFVVAERNREIVGTLRAAGIAAVSGDAADPAVLIQAHVAEAAILVITVNDLMATRNMVDTARTINPEIDIMIDAEDALSNAAIEESRLGRVYFSDDLVIKTMLADIERKYES